MPELTWLPEVTEWRAALKAAAASDRPEGLLELARARLDFVRTNALDAAIRRAASVSGPEIRIALLGSCTLAQLPAALRVAGLRHGVNGAVHEGAFGQYWHDLAGGDPALRSFAPTTLILALDAHHLAAGVQADMAPDAVDLAFDDVTQRILECWRLAREAFGCHLVHHTALPLHPALLGANEHRLPGSKAAFVARVNAALRPMADAAGVDLLALDDRAARDGVAAWHDPGFWHRAKQEISPAAAPMYGDLVMRLIAARQGRARKCLVLDLDNTLWGGVIGDDGMQGIVLGQGSALGEAFVAFQVYVRELSRRGVILAVCSKNDEARALEPFDKHPEMILRRADIAMFVANWTDKAENLRAIAAGLNIGLDSLVFADDNPFERDLVRSAWPMVAVPEIGDDPTRFAQIIADAGYFEGVAVTGDDRARAGQYHGNIQREASRASATDLSSYLRGLDMRLLWRRFDEIGLSRIVQLINKTNQFNLTTRRVTEADILAVMRDDRAFGLQLRLLDRFGDNGVVAIVIGRMDDDHDLRIDAWLMSCRVLGRQLEQATLNLVVEHARLIGARRVLGDYVPTPKNGMVREHYAGLGFAPLREDEDGASRSVLDLADFLPAETFIAVQED